MVKYIVMPGWVRSRNDQDRHYVGAARLIKLYGVNPSECLIIHPGMRPGLLGYDKETLDKLPVLSPRYDGKYNLEKRQNGTD